MFPIDNVTLLVAVYLPWAAIAAGLGAFAGICAAKLLRSPILRVMIDGGLGIIGSWIGFLWYTARMYQPEDFAYHPNRFFQVALIGSVLLPVAYQCLRSAWGAWSEARARRQMDA